MIQRIQTLYLFIASASLACMFFFPIYTFTETQADATVKEVKLTIQGRFEMEASTNEYVLANPNYAKSLMVLAIGLAFFVTIFQFNNRVRQLRITRIMIIATFAFIVTLLSSAYNTVNAPGVSNIVTGMAVIFPSISIVFAALAARAIKKDENLVRSADRLR
jgi:Domain of unknown function (DUF4293)